MITLNVNGTDRTDQIKWEGLVKKSVLTRQPDTLTFSLRNYNTKTWKPDIGDEVTLYDDSDIIFGGIVVETGDELLGGFLKEFTVLCKDYTQILDRYLVSKNYTNMTAGAIVNDIITNFTTAGTFTTTNVVATTPVSAISFNYLTVSQAFQKLCEMVPGYDWYVDYNKDIHFFFQGTKTAPYNLADNSENYIYQTLTFEQDNTQIRNFVTIRGGQTQGTAVDNKQVADGQQRVFFVGYNLGTFLAYKALAASPTSFTALTVGKDGIDDPSSYNCLYNPDRGLLTFPDASKPAVGDVIKYTGIPVFPLIAQAQDLVSIAEYGVYQYVIVDKTITTKGAAKQRAQAELIQYANPTTQVSFKTYTPGLKAGQVITVNCPSRGINGTFKISRVSVKLKTPSVTTSDFIFSIDAVSTLKINLVDLLNKLLVKDVADQIQIGENEVVDRIYSAFETITINETFTAAKAPNPIHETVTFVENFTVTGKNYGTIFVMGPQVPNSTKRVFILNGSLLA